MFRLIRENVERLVESEMEKQALIKEGYKEISGTGANSELPKEEGEEANSELTKEEEGEEANSEPPKKEKAKQEPKKKAAKA